MSDSGGLGYGSEWVVVMLLDESRKVANGMSLEVHDGVSVCWFFGWQTLGGISVERNLRMLLVRTSKSRCECRLCG